jgi:hypothetical protein
MDSYSSLARYYSDNSASLFFISASLPINFVMFCARFYSSEVEMSHLLTKGKGKSIFLDITYDMSLPIFSTSSECTSSHMTIVPSLEITKS